jgi:hypothetical protein
LSFSEIEVLGGQLLLIGDFSRSGNTVNFKVKKEETAYFIWLSKDASGRFSRIEPYSILGPVHLKTQPLYGPRINPV